MSANEQGELGDKLPFLPSCEVGSNPLLDDLEAPLFESGGLVGDERLACEIC